MIVSLLVAAALFQTQDQVLEQARSTGQYLFMGQVCEAVQKSTFDYEALLARSYEVTEAGARAGMADGAVEDVMKSAYEALEADMETRYSGEISDEMFAEIGSRCDVLRQEQPTYFKPFSADN